MLLDFLNGNVFKSVLDNLNDGIYVVGRKRNIIFWNKAAERITGYSSEEVIGRFCEENLLRHVDDKGKPLCLLGCPLLTTFNDGKVHSAEVFLRHKDGHRIPISTKFIPLRDETTGEIYAVLEIFTLTSPHSYEEGMFERLENNCMHDSLTKIPNRFYVESALGYRLEQCKRFDEKYCVMFMDIDNFRKFNNHYGHGAGDKVLIAVCESIQLGMRQGDLFGRWGGEEFVGIFSYKHEKEIKKIIQRIRAIVLNTSIRWEDEDLVITFSGGVTRIEKEDIMDSLVDRADQLMYESKRNGKDQVTFDF